MTSLELARTGPSTEAGGAPAELEAVVKENLKMPVEGGFPACRVQRQRWYVGLWGCFGVLKGIRKKA